MARGSLVGAWSVQEDSVITKEEYTALMGPAPIKADYPGKKGDPAPNARFQVAKGRYKEIHDEIEKVVAVVSPNFVRVNGGLNLPDLPVRQRFSLNLAQKMCALFGPDAVAFVVVRPTTLSNLWLCFTPESDAVFLESHNQQFLNPRPAWIPLDPILAVPSAVATHAASFIVRSVEDGNVWPNLESHPLAGLLPGPTLTKNRERLDTAARFIADDPRGLADLDPVEIQFPKIPDDFTGEGSAVPPDPAE